MTPDERKILEEAEQQAFDTASAFYDVPTSGIRPPPSIEETETTLEPQLFGFEFGQQPEAEAEPFSFSEGGVVCPATITVRFSDVLLDCGCMDGGAGNSLIITDVSVNGVDSTLNSDNTVCGDPSLEDCAWSNSDTTMVYHEQDWANNSTCSGPPDIEGDHSLFDFFVIKKSGITYILLSVHNFLIFYGSTPDTSLPITNESFCSGIPTTWDNPMTNCLWGGPHDYWGIGELGTATIS